MIVQKDFSEHMKKSYIDYAKEVILQRAIPSVEDGLKPVQRRILQSMYINNLHPNAKYKKSSKTVGDTLSRAHPHGDQSVYEAMVNMSQEWKQKYPLVDMYG